MATLASLTVDIAANTAKFSNGMQKVDRRFKKFERSANRAARSAKLLFSAIASGVAARAVQQTIANTAAISELADRAGVSAERMQELQKSFADLGGVSEQVTSGALRRFNRRLGLAIDGTGAAKDTFDELGVAMRDANGYIRDTESVLDDAIRAIAEIESESQRAAKASEMFGEDAGPALAAVLGQGSAALDDHTAKLREQGRVLGSETVANARAANDQLNEMRDIISTRFNQQIIDNAESFMRLADALATVAEKGMDAFAAVSDVTRFLAEGAAARTGGIAGDDIARLERERERIKTMLNLEGIAGMGQRLRFFGRDGLVQYYSRDELEQELSRIDAQIAQHYAQASAPGSPQDRTPVLDPVQVTGTAPSDDGSAGTPTDPGPSRYLTNQIDRQVELMHEQAALYQELGAEGRRVWEDTRTPLEQLNVEMARLDELLDAGAIDFDTYARATMQASEAFDGLAEKSKETADEMSEFWKEAARSMQNSMSDLFFGVMQGELGDL
ncbi:MAG: phage tail tape measure protein, partial [Pirellulaceae bacterium]